jgi:hypothetical protein
MFGNLFNIATTVIPPETAQYMQFLGNNVNAIGLSIPTYADSVDIQASIQPVGDNAYKDLGLDFQKEYYYVYSNQRMHGLNEQAQPDRLHFHGKDFMVQKNCYWNEYDGWGYVLAVRDDI